MGRRLARQWQAAGEEVIVTTRSTERAEEFADEGLTPVLWDVTEPDTRHLPLAETIVFAVGFDRQSGHSIDKVYVDGLGGVLDRCAAEVHQFIYVSSTGVYGQSDGSWIDEDSPCHPIRAGGRACLAAEQLLQQHPLFRHKATILRMAGIYGPNRIPQLTVLQRNEPLHVVAGTHVNLIHVDDVVNVIDTCTQLAKPPCLYCVSDGHPVVRSDYYDYLTQLLGCPPPIFASPRSGSTQAERAGGDKRVCNELLRRELPIEFKYTSYREGLQAIVGQM